MGAYEFRSFDANEDAAQAFSQAREEAAYQHGHGGYTGTIAEKPGYRIFEVPAGVTVEAVIDAFEAFDWDSPRPEWMPESIADQYGDKWGDCIAIKEPTGGWHFIGMASS